jgi:hypothetical protein
LSITYYSLFIVAKYDLLLGRWLKSGSFGFAKLWLRVLGQNQMCHLCGWLKLFLKNAGRQKK